PRAAVELGVTQGAVSRQVLMLEEHLGVKLFRRHGGGLELTPEGRDYLGPLREAFDQIAHATAHTKDDGAETKLIVNLPPSVAALWLMPRLPAFKQRYPKVSL